VILIKNGEQMAKHFPFKIFGSKAITTPQAQNQLAAEMEMIHDIIPSMYTAYTDTGVQPLLNFYQLANKYTGWVYTAIEKKARTIAGLPKMVYRFEKKPQGGALGKSLKSYHPLIKSYDTLPRHQRRQFLKDNGMARIAVDDSDLTALLCSPNSDEIEFNFWHGAVIRLELTGSIGIYKVPGLFSKYPVSMYNIPTTWTGDLKPLPGRDGKQMIRGYMYTDGNIRQEFTNEEIIWIKYNSLRNPYEGMSAIKSQLSSFNIDTYLLNQQSEFMKNHAVMGNTLTTEQSLTDDAFKSLRQQVRKIFQGGINSGKANVLHSGLKFDTPVRSTTREMMVKEIEHMVRDRILSAHDISAGKVGLVDVQNRSNLDTVNENYINETISPTSKLMCQYLTRDLAKLFDPAFVIDFILPKFENDQIQQENMEDLGAYVKTINEIRAAKDLEPVKWGDMPWIPFNLQQYTGETKPEATPAEVPTEEGSIQSKGGPGSGRYPSGSGEVYHGTSKEAAEKILSDGLQVGDKNSLGGAKVYATDDKSVAFSYARVTTRRMGTTPEILKDKQLAIVVCKSSAFKVNPESTTYKIAEKNVSNRDIIRIEVYKYTDIEKEDYSSPVIYYPKDSSKSKDDEIYCFFVIDESKEEEEEEEKSLPVKSIKSMTTEQKTKLWKKFDTTAKAYEPLYTKAFAGIFSAMKKEVIDNIEKKAVPVKCSISVVSKSNRQKWLKDNNGKIKGLCFDKKEMAKTIQNRIKPVMEKINKDIADEMVDTLTAGTKAAKFKYNVNDPKVQKYIGTRLRELSTSVTDTMADKVESSLSKDFEDGASILTMSENIADVFITEEKYRSDLIARTETTSACSHAELDAVEQMGLEDVLVKIWVAEPDARDTHAEAADKYSDGIPISEDFEVGGDSMSCPGNGSLAEENCNCRCMLVYDTKDAEKSFKGGPGPGRYPEGSGEVYHGTSKAAANKILKEGLLVEKTSKRSFECKIYATNNKALAMDYAKERANKDIPIDKRNLIIVVINSKAMEDDISFGLATGHQTETKNILPKDIIRIESYKYTDIKDIDDSKLDSIKPSKIYYPKDSSKSKDDEIYYYFSIDESEEDTNENTEDGAE